MKEDHKKEQNDMNIDEMALWANFFVCISCPFGIRLKIRQWH
jgi:hypothetical protein